MKFTERVIFFRILLLVSAMAYALSFSADVFFQLYFKSFIVSSATVAFFLFSIFILSFFAENLVKNISLANGVFVIIILFHLTGLSVVNHFRPETLLAISISVFIAGF